MSENNVLLNKGEVASVLQKELTRIAEQIRANHIAAGQVASGRTAASIRAEVVLGEDEAEGIVWGRSPFGTLETGRKAGKVPYNFFAIIRQWIRDKGIHVMPIPYVRKPSATWSPKYTPQERGEMSLAGAIVYTIRHRGTRLHRQGGRTDIYSNVIPQGVETLTARIMAIFTSAVDTININYAQEKGE